MCWWLSPGHIWPKQDINSGEVTKYTSQDAHRSLSHTNTQRCWIQSLILLFSDLNICFWTVARRSESVEMQTGWMSRGRLSLISHGYFLLWAKKMDMNFKENTPENSVSGLLIFKRKSKLKCTTTLVERLQGVSICQPFISPHFSATTEILQSDL